MREIKFRGKKFCQDEWIYGSLITRGERGADGNFIDTGRGECYPLQQDTIGQFTGLHDKNGKEIYEGDIIRTYGSKGDEIKHTVEYSEKEAMYCTKLVGAEMLGGSITQRWLDEFEFEVIGNVHDDPELLKSASVQTTICLTINNLQK